MNNTKILNNLQSIVTIGYLIMVLLGVTFTSAKYARFGINIFSYSDALDFLIAPFKDLQIIAFAIIPLFITFFFIQFDKVLESKFPKFYTFLYLGMNKTTWFKKGWILYWLANLILYVIFASGIYGKKSKLEFDNFAKTVKVEFQDNQYVNGKLIGSNPNFIFIQDSTYKTLVIPINATVKSIQIPNTKEAI